jgi:hypothetical protein
MGQSNCENYGVSATQTYAILKEAVGEGSKTSFGLRIINQSIDAVSVLGMISSQIMIRGRPLFKT